MAKAIKYLLVGSTEAYSGKSGIILGMIHQLQAKGLKIVYGKPVGTCVSSENAENQEADVELIAQALNLDAQHIKPPLLCVDSRTINKRLKQAEDASHYIQAFQQYCQDIEADLVILEGPANLWEGSLFGLSIGQMAESIDGAILLVTPYHGSQLVDNLLAAKQFLSDRLLGVLINDIPSEDLSFIQSEVKPFLEQEGIDILGMLPSSTLLRSISVREIAKQLNAEVLCRSDRLDLMVENLTIGAMNVNSALKYFRQGRNMAIVTGGDRTDLQLAALETSTHCLILTGHLSPQPLILQRAEDLEIPILSVNLDTLTTVEIIDQAFGQVRLQEPIKVQCIQQLMQAHFDLDNFMEKLAL